MNYVFLADSSCDLPNDLAKSIGIEVLPMQFEMEGKNYYHYLDEREMKLAEFYTKLKDGVRATTSQINYDSYANYFEKYLKEGKDILYVCISAGLSGSINSCRIAVNELKDKYPERRIEVIDTGCDSIGEALLLYKVGQKYKDGCTMDELIASIDEIKTQICHWFVVDDLEHLKRGGRISAVSATFGKALQIKPLLSVDLDGKLVTVGKIRGANKVYDEFVNKLKRDGRNLKEETVVIAHTVNIEGAEKLKELVSPLVKDVIICEVGPIIGAHVGCGLLALIYCGERNLTM